MITARASPPVREQVRLKANPGREQINSIIACLEIFVTACFWIGKLIVLMITPPNINKYNINFVNVNLINILRNI